MNSHSHKRYFLLCSYVESGSNSLIYVMENSGSRINMNEQNEPICGQCVFWMVVPDQDGHALGMCRRFPPTYDGWSMTATGDWCGEFSAKSMAETSNTLPPDAP